MSTREQAENGVSIETQVAKCAYYARAHSLMLSDKSNCGTPGVFVDAGESAWKKSSLAERPGGMALLENLQRGDHLIVTTPHRLFRNLTEMLIQIKVWEEAGIVFHFVDLNMRLDQPSGRLMFHMLGAIAEFKSALRSARLKESYLWRKSKGKRALEKIVIETPRGSGSPLELNGRRIAGVSHRETLPSPFADTADHGVAMIAADLIQKRICPESREVTGVIRAYIRVSTNDQTAASQRLLINRYIQNTPELAKLKIEWYDDTGFSAYRTNFDKRPSGGQVMRVLKPGDVLLTVRIDRVCRSISNLSYLVDSVEAKGATLAIIDNGIRTDTPMGRMMVKLLSFAAELESYELDISSNAAVRQNIMKTGKVCGKIIPGCLLYQNKYDLSRTSFAMTEDQWWEFWMGWYRGHKKMMHKATEGQLVRFAVEWNQEFAKKMGWPVPKPKWRRTFVDFGKVTDAIEEAERMQEEHHTIEREQFITAMRRRRQGACWAGVFCAKHASRAFRRISKWVAYFTPDAAIASHPMGTEILSASERLQALAAG